MLKAIGLSRSTYYYEISKADKIQERNADLSAEISAIYEGNKKRYGVRRVHKELTNRGYDVNHKRVQRIMHKLGLFGKRPKEKYHSYKGEVGKIAPNLLERDFYAEKPNQKWVTDVTEFSLFGEKLYLSPILDLCSEDLVSYTISDRPVLSMVTTMLEKAFEIVPDGSALILHSDQGWQYQMPQYHKALKDHEIIQSMSRKGNCIDNCIMESFFGTLKNEMFYGHESKFKTFEDLYKAIEKYINYYNNERIKSKTKWMPPTKFREASMLSL